MIFLHCKSNRPHSIYPPLGRWLMRGIGKKLKLDEQQNAKFIALQHSLSNTRAYVDQVALDRDAMMHEVLTADAFDRDAALRFIKIPYLAFEEQAPALIDALADFYHSLDQNQRELLKQLWQHHHQSRRRCWH